LIQFRDEDIELADEKHEEKNNLKQSQGQHHPGKGKTGVRNDRKQKPKTPARQQNKKEGQQQSETRNRNAVSKDHETRSFTPHNKDSGRKRGGYHGGQQPSKRPHSDKEKPDQKTESPRHDTKPEKTRTPS
jgi:hypothetical protein